MDLFSAVLGGFGLAAPAGLNAWLPLFITGLAARFQLFGVTLASPFNILSETWVLIALGVLLTIEIFADKIPAVDTINDIIHTFIRPTAGGVLFAAQTGVVGGMDPTVAFILGMLSAGSVHAVKAISRPIITATTGGLGNPIVSMVEDIVAVGATLLALVVPIIAGLLLAVVLAVVAWLVWRWRQRRKRRRAAQI